ncbi:hypothetical protein ACHAW6_008403, partial [Cyclotella cf. meneghiniana]
HFSLIALPVDSLWTLCWTRTKAIFPETMLKLTAVPRPRETDRGNLFVRLSPRTARDLFDMALRRNGPSYDDFDDSLMSGSDVRDVEFLPLEISFRVEDAQDSQGNITLYASYNGGAPASASLLSSPYCTGHVDGMIEIPLDLHPSFEQIFNSSSEPVEVFVRSLPYVPIAKQVTFEPVSTSDWEMIEMEASILEDGGLLNQITIVYSGQILPLRLIPPEKDRSRGRIETAAWVKVAKDGLGGQPQKVDKMIDCSSNTESDTESSSSSCDEDFPRESSIQCVRLMAETEVVIIPKPRVKEEEPKLRIKPIHKDPLNSPSYPLRVQLTSWDFTNADRELMESQLPSPRIAHVYLHPLTILDIPGYRECCNDSASFRAVIIKKATSFLTPNQSDASCHGAIATLCEDENVKEGHIALNPFLRYQLKVHPFTDWLLVQLLPNSFVTNSVNNLRAAVADAREQIRAVNVSLVFEKSESPWRVPAGCISTHCESLTPSTCGELCLNRNAKIEHTSLHPESKTDHTLALFTHGSLIPAEHMRLIGVDVPDSLNCCYRVECRSSSADWHEVGPIIRARDMKQLLNYFDLAQNGEVQAPHDEDSTSVESSRSVMLSDDSILISGIGARVPTFGIATLTSTVISSACSIISSSQRISNDMPVVSQQMYIGIVGDEGTGKSHCAMHIASRLCVSQMYAVVYLGCKKLQSSPKCTLVFILEEIQRVFDDAMRMQPSVLIFDDLDYIIPNVDSGDLSSDGSIHHRLTNPALISQVKVIVDHLIRLSCGCSASNAGNSISNNGGVVCLCTCKDKHSLSSRFMGMIHSLLDVPSFDARQRTEFLCHHLLGNTMKYKENSHFISRLGRLTDGYRPRDLQRIVQQIYNISALRDLRDSCSSLSSTTNLNHLASDVDTILREFTPLSQQSLNITQNDNTVDWDSIGGLFRAKRLFHDIVIHPIKFAQVYNNAPTRLPTGLLIFGYPGCGKSFIVPSLAKQSNLNLITCRGPELLDRYIGASEAKVRALFQRAVSAAPAILFFDEFESLAPQRGSDHTGVTDRVVNQLLTLLDGAERNNKSQQIFVVAATSRPDKIDNALLRPGRLEKHVFLGYPESRSEWNSLFSSILTTRNVDEEVKYLQQNEDLFTFFCHDLDHVKEFCAADLKAVLDTAHLISVHDFLGKVPTNRDDSHRVSIGKKHIIDAFRQTRPSLLPADKSTFLRFYKKFLVGDQEDFGWSESKVVAELSRDTEPSSIRLKTSLR